MRQQEIEITINPDGKVSLKVAGAKGDECLEITRELEEALGEIETRERTSEFYEQKPSVTQNQKAGQK